MPPHTMRQQKLVSAEDAMRVQSAKAVLRERESVVGRVCETGAGFEAGSERVQT